MWKMQVKMRFFALAMIKLGDKGAEILSRETRGRRQGDGRQGDGSAVLILSSNISSETGRASSTYTYDKNNILTKITGTKGQGDRDRGTVLLS